MRRAVPRLHVVALAAGLLVAVTLPGMLSAQLSTPDSTSPGRVTVLYPPFPNPFPAPARPVACIWFDLRSESAVRLEILDSRGRRVRLLIPSQSLDGRFSEGRHGRANSSANTGCDSRFEWDGSADDGRAAPPGLYLVRLRADGRRLHRKLVFRGF